MGNLWLSYFEFQRQSRKLAKNLESLKKIEDETKRADDYTDTMTDEVAKIKEKIQYDFIVNLGNTAVMEESITNMYCWGENTNGVLGVGNEISNGPARINTPMAISILKNRVVHSLACGDYHTLALVSGCGPRDFYRSADNAEKFGIRDVFAWGRNYSGQCDGDPNVSYYNQPVVINQLSGKNVQQVCAFKNWSGCYDKKCNIYVWGASIEDHEIESKHKVDDIKCMGLGNNFRAVLTNTGSVYVWGTIKDSSNDVIFTAPAPKKVNKEPMERMSVGHDHILFTDTKPFLYFFGNNDSGQGGFSEREFSSKTVVVSKYLGGEKIYNIWALEKLSIVQTIDNELYYFGQYGFDPKKVAWYPRDFTIDDEDVMPAQICNCGTNLYMATTNGLVYNWDLKMSHRFKQEKYNDKGSYAQISAGKGFVMLRKAYVDPKNCEVELQGTCETDERVDLKIQKRDIRGDFLDFDVDYKLRVGLCITFQDLGKQQLEMLAKDYVDSKGLKLLSDNSENGIKILYLGTTGEVLKDVLIKPNGVLSLNFKQAGSYNVYLTINEQFVDYAQQIRVSGSRKLEEKINLLARKEEFQLKQKQKKDEQIKREQEKKATEDFARQEKEKIVKDRAEENLKKQQQKVTANAKQEEAIRVMKKDLRTGGGFDMAKYQKKKPEKIVLQSRESIDLNPGIIDSSYHMHQTTGSVTTNHRTYDDIKGDVFAYYDDHPSSNNTNNDGSSDFGRTMRTMNLNNKNSNQDLNIFENKATPHRRINDYNQYNQAQSTKFDVEVDEMNQTGQSFASRSSITKGFKIKTGASRAGGLGRSVGRMSGDNWNKEKMLNPEIEGALASQVESSKFKMKPGVPTFDKFDKSGLKKIKLRGSVTLKGGDEGGPMAGMKRIRDAEADLDRAALGPIVTKKTPIVGGMITPAMMSQLHKKAKEQIGFKKKPTRGGYI